VTAVHGYMDAGEAYIEHIAVAKMIIATVDIKAPKIQIPFNYRINLEPSIFLDLGALKVSTSYSDSYDQLES
jgi:hypothetical protein